MALMGRSKLKGKGRPHKTKSQKKNVNSKLAKPKGAVAKRKAARKSSTRGDAAMRDAPPAAATEGGDDDDFQGMALSDVEFEDDAPAAEEAAADDKQPLTQNQKKKRRKKKVVKKQSALEFEASRDAAASIVAADPHSQANWLWHNYADHAGVGDDQRGGFDGSFMVRMDGNASLEEQLKAAAGPDWPRLLASSEGRPAGAPSALLISASAAGANDLIKQLPALNQACKVAKLFAKHFKVPEQQALLVKTSPAIAVGTPHRLAQLTRLGALKLDALQLVLVDCALDAKQRTILDQPETRGDFWRFFQDAWGPRLAARQTRIGLFSSQKPQLAS